MLSAAHAAGYSRNTDFIRDIGTCSIPSSIHVIGVSEQELQLGDKVISESAEDLYFINHNPLYLGTSIPIIEDHADHKAPSRK
jgi:hypothetical protein